MNSKSERVPAADIKVLFELLLLLTVVYPEFQPMSDATGSLINFPRIYVCVNDTAKIDDIIDEFYECIAH
jgi:hypothetical protein